MMSNHVYFVMGLAVATISFSCQIANGITVTNIAEYTGGTDEGTTDAGFYMGQSFTTIDDGTADLLSTIYLLDATATVPVGTGTLYLFSSEYAGNAGDLASSTTGLLGYSTWSDVTNSWDFSSLAITLEADSTYYFYFLLDKQLIPGCSYTDGYSGGSAFGTTDSSAGFQSYGTYDLDFIVTGTPVPEPATYAGILGSLALGFAALKRRARR
jgi:hypothetical protein